MTINSSPSYYILIDMQGEIEIYQEQPEHTQTTHNSPLEQLRAAIRIAEAMPPSKIRKNLIGLINLAPQIEDNLMQKIDLPLEIEDGDSEHPFLKTQFNRDGDSYRSWYNNEYYPAAQGYKPNEEYRALEELEYTKLYYGPEGVGSFYVTSSGNPAKFSCGFFAKKLAVEENESGFGGSWDSFNIADIHRNNQNITIKLTTTILIEMNVTGGTDLTGFLKKQKTEEYVLGKDGLAEVIAVIGGMVEDMQTMMRQHLQAVYLGKTRQINFSTRLENTVEEEDQRKKLAEELRSIHTRS